MPENEWTLLGKVVRTLAPTFKPRTNIHVPATTPAEAPTTERGEYLARYVANCVGCHTQRDPMTYKSIGPDFAGGMEMEPLPLPGADMGLWFTSPNLRPAAGSALSTPLAKHS
ncbi:MAG: cytochrome c [Gemmatimonadetes bacterium]|nr:cytochrome c [Gemmatimonadota bacterium]